jgi:hypothetical protein
MSDYAEGRAKEKREDCYNCGTTDEACTASVLMQKGPCCPTCGGSDTHPRPLPATPWLDQDGATDVDGFLAAYAKDDNVFWRMECGHHMNIVDELIGRIEDKDHLLAVRLDLISKLADQIAKK